MTQVKIFYVKFGAVKSADALQNQINNWIETHSDIEIVNISLSVVEFGIFAAVTYKAVKKVHKMASKGNRRRSFSEFDLLSALKGSGSFIAGGFSATASATPACRFATLTNCSLQGRDDLRDQL